MIPGHKVANLSRLRGGGGAGLTASFVLPQHLPGLLVQQKRGLIPAPVLCALKGLFAFFEGTLEQMISRMRPDSSLAQQHGVAVHVKRKRVKIIKQALVGVSGYIPCFTAFL